MVLLTDSRSSLNGHFSSTAPMPIPHRREDTPSHICQSGLWPVSCPAASVVNGLGRYYSWTRTNSILMSSGACSQISCCHIEYQLFDEPTASYNSKWARKPHSCYFNASMWVRAVRLMLFRLVDRCGHCSTWKLVSIYTKAANLCI